MATFAKATFDAAGYLACRPTYPAHIYNLILSYHTGARNHALDLGCGPGFIALNLAPSFQQVTAIDPSASMIAAALQHDKVTYKQGDAEKIPLPDQSVDLVVAGQAAHWFDHAKSWPELRRVVRPGGSVVYIVSSCAEALTSRATGRSTSQKPISTSASTPMDQNWTSTGVSQVDLLSRGCLMPFHFQSCQSSHQEQRS